MFGLFKKDAPKPTNRLFRLTVHIGRRTNAEMPKNLVGAHVPIFVGALDHEAAAMKAVSSLTQGSRSYAHVINNFAGYLPPKIATC